MKLIRKIFLFSLLVLPVFFGTKMALAKYGLEQTVGATGNLLPTSVAGVNANDPNSVELLVGEIVNIVLSVLGVIFFLIVFYAGFNWMTARGNSEKIDKSKEMIESAAIGIVLVLAAYAITNFVFQNLGTNGSSTATNNTSGTTSGTVSCSGICMPAPQFATNCASQSLLSETCPGADICCAP